MKKIKTIADAHTEPFDGEVNQAIADGWTLVRRYYTPDGYFVAEMEREYMPSCETCKHFTASFNDQPCDYCLNGCGREDKWEAAE